MSTYILSVTCCYKKTCLRKMVHARNNPVKQCLVIVGFLMFSIFIWLRFAMKRILLQDADQILKHFDAQQYAKAQQLFKENYSHKKNLDNELIKKGKKEIFIQKFLDKKKKNHEQAYPYLIKIINEYNAKHNIPKRY